MPHLIHVDRFSDHTNFGNTRHAVYDPREFFIDAYYDSYRQGWRFDVQKTYPHTLYSHIQTVNEEDLGYFIDLRRFVERNAQGDVIYSSINLSYKWCWNLNDAKGDWDRKYSDVSHGYWVLNFENREDMAMWQLMKPTLTTRETSRFNPNYDYHDDANTSRR